MKRRLKQALFSVGSAAASAAVLYTFFPSWVIGFLMMVIIAHEFGHFSAAWFLGADPSLPIFIPLGILVVGSVRVPNQTADIGQLIALAGPLAGAACAFALMVLSALSGFWPGVISAGWFGAWELFNISFGSDGKKFRKWRQEYQETTAQFGLQDVSA